MGESAQESHTLTALNDGQSMAAERTSVSRSLVGRHSSGSGAVRHAPVYALCAPLLQHVTCDGA
ncbi:hypothetical protein M2266_003376 [Streptomyces sp. SPB162]|nr:hypothetical protein [Streptomyces sp. SPB162]